MSRLYGDGPDTTLTTASVLKRDMPWETYQTARLISDRDLQLIRRYDKRTPDIKSSLLDEAGPAYTEALLNVLRNVTKEETVQYVLALLDEMVTANPKRAQLLHQQSEAHLANLPDPYSILLRLLQRTDWFTQEKACKILTAVLEARPNKRISHINGNALPSSASSSSMLPGSAASDATEQTLVSFVDWLCSQLRRPSNPSRSVPVAVSSLSKLLKEQPVRFLFARAGGVQLLAPLLRTNTSVAPNAQLLYEAGLCVWQLTFLRPAAEAMTSAGVVAGLVELVRTAQKEKVVRIALMALRNLVKEEGLDVGGELVELGLPKTIATRQLQNWEDPDIPEALEWLGEELARNVEVLSTFDKYKKEVLSGSLDWSPMHTSDQFWVANVEKFEEKDFQILRVLLKLLEASRETRTLAVGCHDLGQFIQHHPHGRNIVQDLRGKELVMRLMMHPDPEVQKQALLTTQKIMLAKDKLDSIGGT